jgi:hypothetical protein
LANGYWPEAASATNWSVEIPEVRYRVDSMKPMRTSLFLLLAVPCLAQFRQAGRTFAIVNGGLVVETGITETPYMMLL